MEDREKKPLPDDLWFDLEEEIGTIISAEELCPGVLRVYSVPGEYFMQEYLIVLDAAPVADKVQAYGKKIDGLRLYAVEDDSSLAALPAPDGKHIIGMYPDAGTDFLLLK